jgi:hypothetical protein
MRIHLGWIAAGIFVGAAIVGCGPSVSESDLGTIVYEVPTVAGADEPFAYPKLPPPAPGSEAERRVKRAQQMKLHGALPAMTARDLPLAPPLPLVPSPESPPKK